MANPLLEPQANIAFDRIRPDQPVMFELERKDPDAPAGQGPRAKVVKLIDRRPDDNVVPVERGS